VITFHYKAISPQGQRATGRIQAQNRKQALSQLQQQGLKPLQIEESSRSTTKTKVRLSAQWKIWAKHNTHKSHKLSADSAQPFIENLLQLHASGLPIADAIQLIANRVQNPGMKELGNTLRHHLTSGRSLAEAMNQVPHVFDSNLIHLIEAGEATGNLVPILSNSLEHMEANRLVKNEIRAGLAYPSFICSMAIGIGLFTVTNLIPKLQTLSEQMGGQPNWLTEAMLSLADFAVFELPILSTLLVIAGFAFWQWRNKSSEGRLKSDTWLLRTPLAGSIVSDINLSKSFATLHLLLKNGISSIDAMRLSAYAINNQDMRNRFLEARTALQDGASFANAFKRTGVLPLRDLDLIGIGESTGSLLSTLERLAQLHSQQLSKGFKKLTLIVSTLALGLAVSLVALLIFAIVVSLQGVSESILMR